METKRLPEIPANHVVGNCYNPLCEKAIEPDNRTGRYFITMSHPGFNSPLNNGRGYASEDSARSAIRRYSRLGGR